MLFKRFNDFRSYRRVLVRELIVYVFLAVCDPFLVHKFCKLYQAKAYTKNATSDSQDLFLGDSRIEPLKFIHQISPP